MTTSGGADIEGYRELLDEVFDDTIVDWTAEAEASERFPRKLIEHLGARGVFREQVGSGRRQTPRRRQTERTGVPPRQAGFCGYRGRRQPARLGDRPAAALRKIRSPQDDLRAGNRR